MDERKCDAHTRTLTHRGIGTPVIATTWMNPEGITLSELSQKDTYCGISHVESERPNCWKQGSMVVARLRAVGEMDEAVRGYKLCKTSTLFLLCSSRSFMASGFLLILS